MRRGFTIATAVLAVLATAGSVLAQQTPRIRAGRDSGIAEPRRTKFVSPVYPPEAKAEKVEGTVVFSFVVSTEGNVIETHVTKSVPLLDEAVVAAVSQWKYTPTLLNGQPIEVILTASIRFTLE